MAQPWIALLTDFGTQDVYVGVLKGVLATQSPQAKLIDLSHQVPRGQVAAGAFMLWQAAGYLPAGTIYLAVVDPGVGTDRRGIAAVWPNWSFVGPDNGLISYWMEQDPPTLVCELSTGGEPASHTFHGRDIFAPAAAQLANGVPATELGPRIKDPVRLAKPELRKLAGGAIEGELLYGDVFGNWVSSIGQLQLLDDGLLLRPWLSASEVPAGLNAGEPPTGKGASEVPAGLNAGEPPTGKDASGVPTGLGGEQVRLIGPAHYARLPDGTELKLRRTFGEVPPGSPLAYVGSSGLLEIGVNQGSAGERFGFRPGQRIQLIVKE